MKKRLLSILTLLTMTGSLFSPIVLAQGDLNENRDIQTESVEEVAQEEDIKDTELESSKAENIESEESVVELEDLTIHDRDGNEIKEDNELIVTNDEKVEITAKGLSDKDYQWQIANPESKDENDAWIDIQGGTEDTLELSYALIKNLLVEDETKIRVRSDKDKEHFSTSVKVIAEESEVEDGKDVQPENEKVQLAENKVDNEEPELGTYSIVINYIYENGTQAAPSYTATVAENTEFKTIVDSPTVQGYKPDKEVIEFTEDKVTGNITETVTYSPAEVKYTVKHLFQNIDDDGYTEGFVLNGQTIVPEIEDKTGLTEAEVGKKLEKQVPGFYALNYDSLVTIAADGSTEIQIKYNREYYLMEFDLVGGYGVEPIYARYQTPIAKDKLIPEKSGYKFEKWDKNIPTEIPAKLPEERLSYKAIWTAQEVGYTVVHWYENADDDAYSYAGQSEQLATAGKTVNSVDFKDANFTGKNIIEH